MPFQPRGWGLQPRNLNIPALEEKEVIDSQVKNCKQKMLKYQQGNQTMPEEEQEEV